MEKFKIVRVSIEGCCHGELNAIYDAVAKLKPKPEILIIAGDFQAVRCKSDLRSMSVPEKYQKLGDFADYYRGIKRAPLLTLFIGGNHEASNYMTELFYGGWVARNIYYMGAANVLWYKGVRIGGISGIWSPHHYELGHYEKFPFDYKSVRSAYHIRHYDVFKLSLLRQPLNTFVSHDWPAEIYNYGDCQTLLREKPFFKAEIKRNELGSPPALQLLQKLRPKYWFSAHLHVKFVATYPHQVVHNDGSSRASQPISHTKMNPDEINLDDIDLMTDVTSDKPIPPSEDTDKQTIREDEAEHNSNQAPSEESADNPTGPENTNVVPGFAKETKFLALDKCVRNRHRKFLENTSLEVDQSQHQKFLDRKSLSISFNDDSMQKGKGKSHKRKRKSGARINVSRYLFYDPEWLAITKVMDRYFSRSREQDLPNPEDVPLLYKEISEAEEWVKQNIIKRGRLGIPMDFRKFKTKEVTDKSSGFAYGQTEPISNNQTKWYCKLLDIPDRFALDTEADSSEAWSGSESDESLQSDIPVDDDDDDSSDNK